MSSENIINYIIKKLTCQHGHKNNNVRPKLIQESKENNLQLLLDNKSITSPIDNYLKNKIVALYNKILENDDVNLYDRWKKSIIKIIIQAPHVLGLEMEEDCGGTLLSGMKYKSYVKKPLQNIVPFKIVDSSQTLIYVPLSDHFKISYPSTTLQLLNIMDFNDSIKINEIDRIMNLTANFTFGKFFSTEINKSLLVYL